MVEHEPLKEMRKMVKEGDCDLFAFMRHAVYMVEEYQWNLAEVKFEPWRKQGKEEIAKALQLREDIRNEITDLSEKFSLNCQPKFIGRFEQAKRSKDKAMPFQEGVERYFEGK